MRLAERIERFLRPPTALTTHVTPLIDQPADWSSDDRFKDRLYSFMDFLSGHTGIEIRPYQYYGAYHGDYGKKVLVEGIMTRGDRFHPQREIEKLQTLMHKLNEAEFLEWAPYRTHSPPEEIESVKERLTTAIEDRISKLSK